MTEIHLQTDPVSTIATGIGGPEALLVTGKQDATLDTGKVLKILHLEDVAGDVLLVANALKKGGIVYESEVVENKADFIKALKYFSPDIILADHSLPSFNSMEALTIFQETGRKIPFILITSAMSDEFAVDIIKQGANDYILKDRLNRLVTAIKNSLEKFKYEKEQKNYLEELEKKERRFRALVENSTDAVVILDINGKPTYASSSVKQMLGYTEEEITQIDLLTIAHPDDLPALAIVMEQVLENPGVSIKGHTGRMLHKDGSWRWLEATITNLLHDPAINGIVDNFRDVTERKLGEERLVNANRLYAFISQINQALMHSMDEKTVFREACRIAIEYGKFSAAWIGIFDQDRQKINLVEESGIPAKDIYRFKNAPFQGKGPQYHVLINGDYYVCNDVLNELESDDWKKFAIENHIGSVMVLPVRKSDRIIGSFNFYAREIAFFTPAEIALLQEATKDISFALDILEKERLKILADEKLVNSESSLKQAQAISHLGSWDVDYVTGIATCSEEQLRIYGLSPEDKEQPYKSWLSFVHPDDMAHVLKITNEAKLSFSNADFFYRIIRTDGAVRYIHAQSKARLNNEGEITGLHGVAQDITETRKAEQALRESESNLQAIFENTSEGFILTDTAGIIKSFNNKSKETIFLNTEQVIFIGASIFDFVHPSRKGTYKNAVERVLNGGTLRYDYSYTRKNGDIKWFDFKINPVYGKEKITGLSITSTDITERKKVEESLMLSESNLNAIIENTDAFIYSLDRDFRYITFNNALLKMMKELYGLDIMPGYYVFDFIKVFDPAGVQEWHEIYSKALNGDIIKFEKEFIVDGFYSYTSFSIHPIWENGRVIGLSCFVHDITQARKAEVEILKAYEEKDIILESIGDAFFAVDKNWVVTYWNNHAEEMLKVNKSEIIGQNLWHVFATSIDSASFRNYHQAVEAKQLICFQDYFALLDKWFEINAYPSESGLSVFFKDITQQRQSENEREKMTADILQRNKVLEQFSYIISHNLRAPVTNIIGLAFTLQKDNLDAELKKKVISGLSYSVIKLDEVIKDLNDILTVKQEMKMLTEMVNFSKLVNDIWLSIEHMIVNQNAVLSIDFSEVNQILTVKSYLHSIFYNLISNSLKYRQPGISPKIEIKSYKLKDKVILVFKDNGLGIDLRKKGDEVFGLYKRFHTKQAEGKGMGLYMVKIQVESLGGNISITSEVNKGTEFKIEFLN